MENEKKRRRSVFESTARKKLVSRKGGGRRTEKGGGNAKKEKRQKRAKRYKITESGRAEIGTKKRLKNRRTYEKVIRRFFLREKAG